MTAWQALYRWLLRFYPPAFHAEFAEEMQTVFAEAMPPVGWARGLWLWRELSGLLHTGLALHWVTLQQSGGINPMNTFPDYPHLLLQPAPGSWRHAVVAGAPHVLLALLFIVPPVVSASGSALSANTVAFIGLGLFAFTALFVLARAWRRGWPQWSAPWLTYAGLVTVIFALPLAQEWENPTGRWIADAVLYIGVPLGCAGALVAFTRRDPVQGLLAALCAVIVLWYPQLEFVPNTIRYVLSMGMFLLAALVSALLVRLNNARVGLWLALGLSLLSGLLIAYFRTYWHTIPAGHFSPPTVTDMVELFTLQFVSGATLLIGPPLAWGVWRLGQRHGRAGMWGAGLLIGGLALHLIGQLSYWWWFSTGRYFAIITNEVYLSGNTWPALLVKLSVPLTLWGALWLSALVWRAHKMEAALLAVVPVALPVALMLPIYFGNHVLPAGLSFEIADLSLAQKYAVFAVELIWLMLGGWLVTRLGRHSHHSVHA